MAGAECAARSTIRDSYDCWLDCLVGLSGFHFVFCKQKTISSSIAHPEYIVIGDDTENE